MGLYNKPQEIPGILSLKLYKNTEQTTIKNVKNY